MFIYRLKPYLQKRYREANWFRGYLTYEYAKEIYPEGEYHQRTALSWYANVTFYSKKRLQMVPAANGVLLPVKFFDEEVVE